MEQWTSLSTPSVADAYAEQVMQAPHPAPQLGDLFRQALADYSAAQHPEPVMAPPVVHLVPAESSSLFSIIHGFLRGRAPRA